MINHFAGNMARTVLRVATPLLALAAGLMVPWSMAASPVTISEISYNPPGTDADHEWIEIHNPGPQTVDLAAWKLYQGGHRTLQPFQGGTLVPAGGYAVVTGSGSVFLADYPGFSGVLLRANFTLLNTGDELGLIDDTGAPRDTTTYPATGANGDGHTLERDAAGQWLQSRVVGGTPGGDNSVLPPLVVPAVTPVAAPSGLPAAVAPGQVMINEIVSAPLTGQAEWIEFCNLSDHPVDLATLTIEDATGTPKPLQGTLVPGGRLVIEPAPVSLNNDGDVLILRRASDGVVIDLWSYGSAATGSGTTVVAPAGRSLGRFPDALVSGSGSLLRLFALPTKGAPNAATNQPPVAVITVQSPGATLGEAPFAINFSAESSFDPDGDVLSYVWEYGDGTVSVSENPPKKLYGMPGTFTVRLTVTDAWDVAAIQTVSVTVTPPTSPAAPSSTLTASTCPSRFLSSRLVLNEILPDPTGNDGEGEFVEIANGEAADVDLCGWMLDDGDPGGKVATFGPGTVIAARGQRAFFAPMTGLSLSNAGEELRLLDPDGREVSSVRFPAAVPGRSLSRFVHQALTRWDWSDPTPDQPNAPPPAVDGEPLSPAVPVTVRLNEVLPDPSGADREGEFIELRSEGAASDLSGFTLRVGRSSYALPEGTLLPLDTVLALPYAVTGVNLPNAGGTVELLDPTGVVVDSLRYRQAPPNQSFAYLSSLREWTWTAPTPGAENRDGPAIGGVDLPGPPFAVDLRQGKKLLYLQGRTVPDSPVRLSLFLLDAEGQPVFLEPDIELLAHSSLKRGSFSVALHVALDPGVYRVAARISPPAADAFEYQGQIEILPTAVQASPRSYRPRKRATRQSVPVPPAPTARPAPEASSEGTGSGAVFEDAYFGGTTAEDGLGKTQTKRLLTLGLGLFIVTGAVMAGRRRRAG